MRYSLLALGLAATSVFAQDYTDSSGGEAYVIITTTALTTYCPSATTLVQGSNTYTVTAETTLVITDCPCTMTSVSSSSFSMILGT